MAGKKKEKDTEVLAEPKVVDSALEEILADRFSRYSKYIIQERALPDARDGLKPVQRRILWAMEEDGNTYTKQYRKSAKTVGNVIGNYHPHGDSSVYDAIVRMSQDWKSAFPLIDMQGNNGSIDDDPAAAMRYTEARLSKIAGYLMEDIDKETVDWSPNFSDEKLEPTVLPARYPNLLVNGITGIAAGYATNIPPHNLGEVIDAAIFRIDHPQSTTKELMKFVPGPDFPTGGIIMGKEGIYEALDTGKGRVVVRSKAEIEEKRSINQIVITEIPYEVIKVALVKRIDEIRLNNKVSGMLDVRDESDRKGLRIVIDLKKEANPTAILNYLYKNTDLQTYYHYNVIAIVNRTPKQLSLGAMLDAFLEHREDVIIKRSRFDLKRKKARLHIVDGLIRMISVLDEVIAIIRASSSKADSKERLIERFGFSPEQAEAIVTLQLYRLSNTDVMELQSEADTLHKDIHTLEELLKDPAKRQALMKEELKEVKTEFPSPRRSQIRDEIEELVINEMDMVAEETVVPVVSSHGYFKRVSLRSFASSDQNQPALKEGDHLVFCDQASTLDFLLFFTDRGRYGVIPVYQLEERKWKDLGVHYSSFCKIEPSEKIISVFAFKSGLQGVDLILASREGQLMRASCDLLKQPKKGRPASLFTIAPNDALVSVVPSGNPEDEVLVVSQKGRGYRVRTDNIPLSRSKSKGVRGMILQSEDALLGIESCSADDLILENSDGAFKRIPVGEISLLKRPAAGAMLFKEVKKKPVTLVDARTIPGSGSVRIASEQSTVVHAKQLAKMTPASTWSTAVILDEPAPFVTESLRLENGVRTLEQEKSPVQQGSLFDVQNLPED